MWQECYSANSRKTPLLHPKDCLTQHTQYICGTCGRCICIERDSKRGLHVGIFLLPHWKLRNCICEQPM